MPYPTLPSVPLIIFDSGDRAVFVREIPLSYDNVPYSGIYMILDEQTMWRYNVTEADLNYKISQYGAYYAEYPTQYISNRSLNPENPMYLCHCNFNGSLTVDSEIKRLELQIVNLQKTIGNMQVDIDILQGQLKHQIEINNELKSKTQGDTY